MLLRQALRFLRKSPGYVAACVVVLALGIGANAAIFTLLYDAILKPLPYPDAERLVLMYSGFPSLPAPAANHMPVSRPLYQEWQRQASSFDDVAAFYETSFRENGVDRPQVLRTALVAANFLPLLGATTEAGRLFRADEETPGKDFVVVLSDRYFEQRFMRDPNAIGRTIAFGGVSYVVIGVLDARFQLPATVSTARPGRPDIYIPLSRAWTRPEARSTDDPQRRRQATPGRGPRSGSRRDADDNRAAPPVRHRAVSCRRGPHLLLPRRASVRGFESRALRAARRGGARAAHRLRQPRQPHARARLRAVARSRCAPSPRRLACRHRASTADRIDDLVRGGRHRGPPDRKLGHEGDAGARAVGRNPPGHGRAVDSRIPVCGGRRRI